MLEEITYTRKELLEELIGSSHLEIISDHDDITTIGDTETNQVFFLIWESISDIKVCEMKLQKPTDEQIEFAKIRLKERLKAGI